MSVKCQRQTSAGNNCVYVAHMQNNTQKHVLLSTREFCLNIQASIIQRKNKISTPLSSHSAHVCRLKLTSSFSRERMTARDRKRHRRKRKTKYGSMCAFKSVPRPEPSVGKVAQCLSHDPCEEAFFLLDPWMEMRRHRKLRKANQHIHTHCVCVLSLSVCLPAISCSHFHYERNPHF